jgi:hypothetical protein
MPMPPIPRKIQIVVNSTYEDFSINPARCSVFPLNSVEWDVKVDSDAAEEFLLIFDSDQAFGGSVLWHSPSAPLGPQQPSGPKGSEYHYKIVVKQQGKVYVDAYCPSIIIR